ncbi:MAG: AtpZ/AtpI family protein [Polyangiaceae bacterium]|nr:AtpZ/AtpI family protein [Myxococcales bacterium]MCB9589269.1 AtpZ/AtpI family protein [Polyangiaceae bacterium]
MQQNWKALGTVGTVGLEFVLSIAVGLWVGQKLDGWLGTGPWMTALWLVFGLVAGIRAIVRASAHLQRETEELERQEREERKRYHERKGHDR